MSEKITLDRKFTLRMSSGLWQELTNVASSGGLSESEYARRAVAYCLNIDSAFLKRMGG